MNTLPINTIIAPAQTSNKPASNDDAASQGAQGFGDVLARRVADASSPSDKNSGQEAKDTKDAQDTKDVKDVQDSKDAKDASSSSATVTDKEAKDASAVPDIASLLPADMMAALLAQQNPNSLAKATAPLQAATDTQAQASTPELSLTIAASKGESTQPDELAGNTTLPQAAAPRLDTTRPEAFSASNNKPTFTDTLKETVKNDVTAAVTGDAPRKHLTTELAATIQQPTLAASSQAMAGNTPMAAAALSSQLTVNTPVNHPAWGNEFSQKITWLAAQRDQSAELHLNPPQLGPLDVVIKVSADQATALFTSPHAAVREAIEQALPKLREMLADNGIMLGNATVSDQASRRDQNDSARAQQGSGTDPGRVEDVTAVMSQGERVSALPRHNGMVDTFA